MKIRWPLSLAALAAMISPVAAIMPPQGLEIGEIGVESQTGSGALPAGKRFDVDAADVALAAVVAPPDGPARKAADAPGKSTPLHVGVVLPSPKGITISRGQAKAGAVYALADGRHMWRTVLRAPDAVFIELDFAELALPVGAELYAFDPAGTILRGPFTADDLDATPRHRLPAVMGDTVVVEIAAPAEVFGAVTATLGAVGYGYRAFAGLGNQPSAKAGACHVDVACDTSGGLVNQRDAVGQYTYVGQLQGQISLLVCTGQLVANTRRDATPLFLTANHCVSRPEEADSVVLYWNYQSPVCRAPGSAASGTALPRSVASHVQSGAGLLATFAPSDFTLLLLSRPVPRAANLYFSGWDRRDFAPATSFSIHQPDGSEKRLSATFAPAQITAYLAGPGSGITHLAVSWDLGLTEGGSSGGGLWDGTTGLLVGQLHGGLSECDAPDDPDWYGRLAVSWAGGGSPSTRLADWLDPLGSGVAQFGGYRANAVAPSALRTRFANAGPDWNLDGNGSSDLLWYNPASGQTVVWFLDWQGELESQTSLLQHAQWRVVSSGDFNADGRSDLIWYNPASGETYYWLMNDTEIVAQGSLLVAAGWRVTHTADVDGNGRDDLLWYNPLSGESYLWLIRDDGSITGISLLVHPHWRIVATADLNGDFRGDLIWHNPASGESYYWMMNGSAVIQGGTLLQHPSWRVVAAGDLDGNGRGDLLWHNPASGESFAWLMDGARIVGAASLLVHPHWRITGTGDFNNDGLDDLLWYNPASGETFRWLMDGLSAIDFDSVFVHPQWRTLNQ